MNKAPSSNDALEALKEAHEAAAAERNGDSRSFWSLYKGSAPWRMLYFFAPPDFQTYEALHAGSLLKNCSHRHIWVRRCEYIKGLLPAGQPIRMNRLSRRYGIGVEVVITPLWMPAKGFTP